VTDAPRDDADYDSTGVRATMLRGGTSRGLFFEPDDLPADPAAREELLLRLMGTPDPRQIDGLGGSTSLTSKVAVVGPSDHPDADVDYLFLQLGVDEPTVSDQQNCGNILAGVGPFAVERGLVPAGSPDTTVRIRMVNSDSIAVASFPTPDGRVEYRGDVAIAGVPGTAAPVVLAFTDTEGSATGSLLPTGNVRDSVDGIEVTCVDNGMPVVVAMAESFGLTGDEPHEQLAADTALLERVDAFRCKAGRLMGLGDVSGSSVPKTALLSRPRDAARSALARSSRCSRTPRSACWPR
jgi:4-oxalomesaconate tautomerase